MLLHLPWSPVDRVTKNLVQRPCPVTFSKSGSFSEPKVPLFEMERQHPV